MCDRALFAYAHARLQAHNGRRPTKSTWHHLNSSKSLGHYLESARQTGLNPWVSQLTATTDMHGIERALRRDWQAYAGRVALWLPRDWRPVVVWTGQLADLPMTVHQARDRKELSAAPGDSDIAWAARHVPLAGWLERLGKLWPRTGAADIGGLENLLGILRRHLALDNPAYLRDGVEARYHLIACLERLFHHNAQCPTAVFAFLGMVALDIEHLRAHLVHRCLFPETLDNR